MTTTTFKPIQQILPRQGGHWVGDGFPVTSVLSPQAAGDSLSPFILFDYAAPTEFPPSKKPRGVDTHPHRGFETVTIVYQGGLQHRDSAGNRGKLGPGDVQWMTAASGVLHEEKHSDEFTRDGGTLEMAQLWVNLPAREKMTPPRYQDIAGASIPTVDLPGGAGTARVISGELFGARGAAKTVTPVLLWDVKLEGANRVELPIPAGHNSGILVRRGSVRVDGETLSVGDFAIMGPSGDAIAIESTADTSELVVLGGEPLNEPVVAHGPFVMNSEAEIREAIADLRAGKFGEL